MADEKKSDVSGNRSPDVEGSAVEEEKFKDPNVVDFDGPDDPENPMNWSSAKKTTAIVIISLMTLLSYVTYLFVIHPALIL